MVDGQDTEKFLYLYSNGEYKIYGFELGRYMSAHKGQILNRGMYYKL